MELLIQEPQNKAIVGIADTEILAWEIVEILEGANEELFIDRTYKAWQQNSPVWGMTEDYQGWKAR